MNITREDVRKQLQILGYPDVPEDVVDEFLAELKAGKQTDSIAESKTSSEPTSKPNKPIDESSEADSTYYTEYNSLKEGSSRLESDLSSLRHDQSSAMYSPPVLRQSKKEKLVVHPPPDAENIRPSELHGRAKKRRPQSARERRPLRVRKDDHQDLVDNMSNLSIQKRRPQSARYRSQPTARGLKSQTTYNRRNSVATPRSFGIPRPRKASYRKKVHDPVSRYQQMQATWKNDRFLNKRRKGRKPLRLQVRREMREISSEGEKYGYIHFAGA